MEKSTLRNVHIVSQDELISPRALCEAIPVTPAASKTVLAGRQAIQDILDGKDQRIFVVAGPCSIHDVDCAMDYAKKIKALAAEVSDTIYVVMRVYFEKPRTTVGWKGLINDPDLNDSFNINKGLHVARKLLLDLAEMGIPTATEALDPVTPQFIGDLISWTAIGARTSESQTHREMSSGLSTPVGFKNGTDGNLDTCINAIQSASLPHSFLGIDFEGKNAITHSTGNPYSHVVLRGGRNGPNYDSVSVKLTEQALAKAELPQSIVIDCAHANSNKNPMLQPLVMENCIHQITEGNTSILGLMIESHLKEGNQKIPADLSQLEYGVSVTDGCVSWETTESMLKNADQLLKQYWKRA
ncbi:3-deoxy-7-phosphoheptulonate synthase [Ostreibacterium oceani]|uniref:Phospho-2-dehydro-3-deoxyheptonate aldolase n=1 Tax=Ostreibacterium oceani TaxID=2654998 RepID=A0A6N7EWN4_9GAMM|nr:3-deoxy-7-phosphoheptulonate synthase [Ostreibacterium oceani]MPV85829.1 3-deoxy-7-phosphoheptulonate synthase [Ostreibacterium oceani]